MQVQYDKINHRYITDRQPVFSEMRRVDKIKFALVRIAMLGFAAVSLYFLYEAILISMGLSVILLLLIWAAVSTSNVAYQVTSEDANEDNTYELTDDYYGEEFTDAEDDLDNVHT